jgi:hypothetical protein
MYRWYWVRSWHTHLKILCRYSKLHSKGDIPSVIKTNIVLNLSFDNVANFYCIKIFNNICLTESINILVPLVASVVLLLYKIQRWTMPKDRNFTTFRIQTYISNLVPTTRVWIHLWSSVTERILKCEKVKYIQVGTRHICVSVSNQDLDEVDFLVFLDLRWKVVACFVSIGWIVYHRYFNVISIKWLRMNE